MRPRADSSRRPPTHQARRKALPPATAARPGSGQDLPHPLLLRAGRREGGPDPILPQKPVELDQVRLELVQVVEPNDAVALDTGDGHGSALRLGGRPRRRRASARAVAPALGLGAQPPCVRQGNQVARDDRRVPAAAAPGRPALGQPEHEAQRHEHDHPEQSPHGVPPLRAGAGRAIFWPRRAKLSRTRSRPAGDRCSNTLMASALAVVRPAGSSVVRPVAEPRLRLNTSRLDTSLLNTSLLCTRHSPSTSPALSLDWGSASPTLNLALGPGLAPGSLDGV